MLEADQMNALFDYTRESMADQADNVISAADEQEQDAMRNKYHEGLLKQGIYVSKDTTANFSESNGGGFMDLVDPEDADKAFKSLGDAIEQYEVQEAMEREELRKLKKKYEVVNRRSDSPSLAEKDEC